MAQAQQAAIAPEEITAAPRVSRPVGASEQVSRVEKMREYFANRPKEKIRIRASEGEQWVQINGYAFRIQAGEDVEVPVDVASILREAGII
jgi:hypothetical protein